MRCIFRFRIAEKGEQCLATSSMGFSDFFNYQRKQSPCLSRMNGEGRRGSLLPSLTKQKIRQLGLSLSSFGLIFEGFYI